MKKIITLGLAILLGGCTGNRVESSATPLKVLMIGNSFSVSLMSHLPQVALSLGRQLDLTSLYIGGCSLERHWQNIQRKDEFKPYQYRRNVLGRELPRRTCNLPEVLNGEAFDIVTIQQASHASWQPQTYYPYGDNLVAYIRKTQPKAKILVQETWSYTPWDKRLAKWGIDQNQMYEKLRDAYATFAAKHGLEIIKTGTAIQRWRRELPVRYTENSFGGDVVGGGNRRSSEHFQRDKKGKWVPNCDVFHLSSAGEYFQALIWAAKLFDVDVTACTYCPKEVTNASLMKSIAKSLPGGDPTDGAVAR